jgi:hypothetical protein
VPWRFAVPRALGETWIQKMVGPPAAREDALRHFEQATAQQAEATLIVGSQLSTSGKCYLARWDGLELVVLELDRSMQADWRVNPRGLHLQLHLPEVPLLAEPASMAPGSLTDVRIDVPVHNAWTPLTGTCRFEMDAVSHPTCGSPALRLQYYRPDLPRRVTVMWYADSFLPEAGGELRFQFPPLFSAKNPQPIQGGLVLFLQLLTAADWSAWRDCRKASNVAATIIRIQ